MPPVDAVLLIAFGGPTHAQEVRPFLTNVLRGRPVPPERLEEVVHHYEAIGGASPLTSLTFQQAKALESQLAVRGTPVPVYVGMKNWHPLIPEVLEEMSAGGIKNVMGIVLSAFRSEVSVDRYQVAVSEALAGLGGRGPHVTFSEPWGNHPLFIEAVNRQIEDTLVSWPEERRRRAVWIFTAHSIPLAMAGASTYVSDFTGAVDRVTSHFHQEVWRLAYQSRSGHPRDPWLAPDVLEVMREEAGHGARDLLLIPIGFVSDHVEVLYDLDVEAAALARTLGVTCVRVPTVGTQPAFVEMLASLTASRACLA